MKIEARCVSCKHKWTMTPQQQAQAQQDGMASCPKCYSPATVERAEAKSPTRQRGERTER